MEDLTLLLVLLCVGMYLMTYVIKKAGINYLCFIISISTICKILTDSDLMSGTDMWLIFVMPLFTFLMSLVAIWEEPGRF